MSLMQLPSLAASALRTLMDGAVSVGIALTSITGDCAVGPHVSIELAERAFYLAITRLHGS